MSVNLENKGTGNEIHVGENVKLSGVVSGNYNKINFAGSREPSTIHLTVSGDNNTLEVEYAYAMKGLRIAVGSHIPAHDSRLTIATNFSIEPGGRMLLYTSGSSLEIGEHCMLSSNITLRCGESPHLIFEKESGAYLDIPKGVRVGNHVWIGENSYLTKSSSVADECVVGACSVVTKAFKETHCAIAGNPARIVRRDVQWIRNKHYLEEKSKYAVSHDEFHARYAREPVPENTAVSARTASTPVSAITSSVNSQPTPILDETHQKNLELARLERRVYELERSISWRITAPLRFIKKALVR